MSKKIMMLAGDGIGPEVVDEVKRIVTWMNKTGLADFVVEEGLIGGAAYDDNGDPLSDETLALAQAADAVLLGAVGGPAYDDLPYEKRPERGLLKIRKEMDLYANLRPAITFGPLADASSLKRELVEDLDIMIVRELTSGVYFGEPRGIEDIGNGERRGFNTQVYTTSEIRRVAKVAFDLARKRDNRLTSVEKENVMESGVLWRQEVTKLHGEEFSDVNLSHMLADNCAMQLVRAPKQFDVIVTDNLFGDLLSDCAAMLTGSLGMLPSASLGDIQANGFPAALYEPVHGSAPDIAGQGAANPLATIQSFSMMLRYSFDMGKEADLVEEAIRNVLAGGLRTADIMQEKTAKVSTAVMGEAIIREMSKLAEK